MDKIINYNKEIARLFENGLISLEEETCGFILPNTLINIEGEPHLYIEICENVASDRTKDFEFSEEDTKKVFILSQTQELILWHTHVDRAFPNLSSEDVITSREWELPILMINVKSSAVDYYDPREKVEYTGRKWSYSYRNCYDLMFDFYLEEFDIELPRFYLEHPKAWENEGWNSYLDNLPTEFKTVDQNDLQYGDLLLMTIGRASGPNHIGIMLEPEKNKFLHHLSDCFSREESLDKNYRRRIHSCWRYKGF